MLNLSEGSSRIKGGCDLPRGTRGKTHPLPAFKVAHLAAGGIADSLPKNKRGRSPVMETKKPRFTLSVAGVCFCFVFGGAQSIDDFLFGLVVLIQGDEVAVQQVGKLKELGHMAGWGQGMNGSVLAH